MRFQSEVIYHQTPNYRNKRKTSCVQRMWVRLPSEVTSLAVRDAWQRALPRGPSKAQQKVSPRGAQDQHTQGNTPYVHSVGETSVRRHILSDTKLQTLKKNPMLEENVAKASVRSHISGYQKRLAGRSVRARNKSAKLSPTVFQCLQTQ